MATTKKPQARGVDDQEKAIQIVERPIDKETKFGDSTSTLQGEIWSLAELDPALDAKMHLVNNAIDKIGLTPYHWKLFVLGGFGYAVDSLVREPYSPPHPACHELISSCVITITVLIQSVIADYAAYEFHPSWKNGQTVAAYVGMLVGALFWGFTADIIGRGIAFNSSLIICSIFTIAAGGSNSWITLGAMICLSAFGGGGNLVLDTAVFLEYLPGRHQWLLTFMAGWWGVGQLITGLFAWGFLPNFSCESEDGCTKADNMGWRYVWYASGAFVFVMSLLRIFVIRFKETPKYLLSQGRDADVVENLRVLATKYNRPFDLTVEQLEECGETVTSHAKGTKGFMPSFGELLVHLRGLFLNRTQGISTILIWLSWTLIGLAYPLFQVFLPQYLKSRGAEFGEDSDSVYWRNYLFANVSSIFGPLLAGGLCEVKWLGRKGTMVFGAIVTMIFFFSYTQVRSGPQNVGFTCAISFWLNIYYGTLYAYTPEVLPSAHRGTGNGIAVACNRLMGIISALVATYANTSTPVPIYTCAALFAVLAIIAALFPYEPHGKRSS